MTGSPAEPGPLREIRFSWREILDDTELCDLDRSLGGDLGEGYWHAVQHHSLGWVTARPASGALVGFANLGWEGARHAFLLDVMTAPSYQHRGIGSQLVRIATRQARDAGCRWLHVDFEAALGSFYVEVCGFRPTAAGLFDLNRTRIEDPLIER